MHRITLAAAGALLFGSGAFAQMTTPPVSDPSNPANVSNTPTSDVSNQPEQGTPIQRPGPASATDTMEGTNAGTVAPPPGTPTTGTMAGSSATGSTSDDTVAPADGSAATGNMTTPANPADTMGTSPPAQTAKRSGKPKPQDR